MNTADPLGRWRERLARLRAEPSTDAPDDAPRLARVGRTHDEMMRQGEAIQATLASPAIAEVGAMIAARRPSRLIVAGCGDSWFAGLAAAPLMERATGLPSQGLQAFEHAHFGGRATNESAAVIGISSGGNTPAVMDALAAARPGGAMAIGVSNTPGSPVMTQFDAGLLVEASRKGWPTQSSTATIALLVALGCAIGGGEAETVQTALADLARRMDGAMALAFESCTAPAESIASAPLVLLAGAGPDHAAACFGAAKLRELSSVHAMALPMEEIHHYRLPKTADRLVLVQTRPEARERALDTAIVARASGAALVAVLTSPDPEIAALADHVVLMPEADGLLGVVPSMAAMHALAYHAAMARSRLGLGGPWR
jgi:glutamine---fructose-6-phosphate transaminase (isomerizing)